MGFLKRSSLIVGTLALVVLLTSAFADTAEARRGGSFGSRGIRTYQSPAATTTAPMATQPIQRSMTPQMQPSPGYATQPAMGRPGLFGGFGGSLLGGLALGGLIGMMFGHGFGGIAGGFGFLLQIAILAFGAMFLFRYFASRNQPAAVGAGPAGASPAPGPACREAFGGIAGFGSRPAARPINAVNANDQIGITSADFDAFERLLDEIQGAFGREDYAGLRERTTPEVMSYLAEELSENATHGLRNDVADVKLLQGDLSEAWSEGDTDYATVAMRYQSRDSMRKRDTGELVSGSANSPTETTEIWTFARKPGGAWKLSAIQDA